MQKRMATAHFDWTLVRSFLAALEAGSLMGAARTLGAHQPTLSRHISELESQLGVALFERTGRGLEPTAAALALADAARQMQAGAQALSQALVRQQHSTQGTVRIAASQVMASAVLPPLLVALQQAEPGIQVELVVSNGLANLLRREADIAVRMVRPQQASLVARKVGEMRVQPCAHRHYLQRAGVPQTPQELLNHRLIGYDRDDTILRGFARMGLPLTPQHFALRTDDQIAYGQLIAAGAGIGFTSEQFWQQWPEVQPLLPQLKIPPLPCWLAVHREIRGNPLVRLVYDHLAEGLGRVLQ